MAMPDDSNGLTTEAVSQLLAQRGKDVPPEEVARIARLGLLPGAAKIDGQWRIPAVAVARALSSEPAQPAQPSSRPPDPTLPHQPRPWGLKKWSYLATIILAPLGALSGWLAVRDQGSAERRFRATTAPLIEATLEANGTLLQFASRNEDAVLQSCTVRYEQAGHRIVNVGRLEQDGRRWEVSPSAWFVQQISPEGRFVPGLSSTPESEMVARYGTCGGSETAFEIPALVELNLVQHGAVRKETAVYLLRGYAGWRSCVQDDLESATARLTSAELVTLVLPGDRLPDLDTKWYGPYAKVTLRDQQGQTVYDLDRTETGLPILRDLEGLPIQLVAPPGQEVTVIDSRGRQSSTRPTPPPG